MLLFREHSNGPLAFADWGYEVSFNGTFAGTACLTPATSSDRGPREVNARLSQIILVHSRRARFSSRGALTAGAGREISGCAEIWRIEANSPVGWWAVSRPDSPVRVSATRASSATASSVTPVVRSF